MKRYLYILPLAFAAFCPSGLQAQSESLRKEICEISVIKKKRCKRLSSNKTVYPHSTRKGITLDKLRKYT